MKPLTPFSPRKPLIPQIEIQTTAKAPSIRELMHLSATHFFRGLVSKYEKENKGSGVL